MTDKQKAEEYLQRIVEERYQDGIDRSQERVFSGEDIVNAYNAGMKAAIEKIINCIEQ